LLSPFDGFETSVTHFAHKKVLQRIKYVAGLRQKTLTRAFPLAAQSSRLVEFSGLGMSSKICRGTLGMAIFIAIRKASSRVNSFALERRSIDQGGGDACLAFDLTLFSTGSGPLRAHSINLNYVANHQDVPPHRETAHRRLIPQFAG
jgi:hypothetical protein